MVDLFNVFRKRPQKRGAQAFARTRTDITALGDTIGDMLTNPVRDAPPIAHGTRRNAPPAPPVSQPRVSARSAVAPALAYKAAELEAFLGALRRRTGLGETIVRIPADGT